MVISGNRINYILNKTKNVFIKLSFESLKSVSQQKKHSLTMIRCLKSE
jgi:hypothetical protein